MTKKKKYEVVVHCSIKEGSSLLEIVSEKCHLVGSY